MTDKQPSVVAKRKSGEGVVVGEGDATKKPKLSFGLGLGLKKTAPPSGTTAQAKKIIPISLKLGQQKPKEPEKKIVKKSAAAARAFAEESDEDEEDMPPEAKMRMKNIGKNTPTSAGPNSFNKGRMGFCSPSAKWKTPRLTNEAEKKSEPESNGDS